MASFTIDEVIKATGADVVREGRTVTFDEISTDTRTINRGNLFIPLSGENFNGHKFVGMAAEKGAAGIIVYEKEAIQEIPEGVTVFFVKDTKKALEDLAHFHRMRFHIPVVAITGSNGKTTTKDMIAAVLSTTYNVVKTEKNHNNEIGMCQTLLGLNEKSEVAVVEMGMRGFGQIDELCQIASPTIGVVTNVGTSHIGILGSQENIAKAKGELVENLPEDGTAVLNRDDAFVAAMKNKMKGEVVYYGINNESDVKASSIEYKPAETAFKVTACGKTFDVKIPVLGVHNVYDALAAIAVAEKLHVDTEEIREALLSYRAASQRQHVIDIHGVKIMDDSYNANPLSMEMAFRSLKQLDGSRRILVLGDMGELGSFAEKLHRETGEKAAEMHFDALITVGELGHFIAEGAREKGLSDVTETSSVEEAAHILEKKAKAGDLVLIKASHSVHMEKILDYLRGAK